MRNFILIATIAIATAACSAMGGSQPSETKTVACSVSAGIPSQDIVFDSIQHLVISSLDCPYCHPVAVDCFDKVAENSTSTRLSRTQKEGFWLVSS